MIAFPLAMPSVFKVAEAAFEAVSQAGASLSPFTGEEQIYVHQGEWLEVEVSCPPMKRAVAEEVVAWLVSLNGLEGSFLLPPPGYGAGARGSLSGAPIVTSGGQTGKTLVTGNWTPGATNVLKAGDWFQLGAGSAAHLYKVVQNFSPNGSGNGSIEFWPRLKSTPADNDPLTVVNPVGCFRLLEGRRRWSIAQAMIYGVTFRAKEAF